MVKILMFDESSWLDKFTLRFLNEKSVIVLQ